MSNIETHWRFCHKCFKDTDILALSLVLEAAELMEHFQWKDETEIKAHLRANKSAVADELSDVFYWVLLMAHDLDIDLEKALQAKMKKNAAKYPVHKAHGNHKKYMEL